MIRKLLRTIGYLLFVSIISVAGLNLVYVSGLFDFYKPELTSFNSGKDLQSSHEKDTILVMGDSFTAGNNSFPNILRNILPDHRIINSGVSGTGVAQTLLMAKDRIERFEPDIFVYQIYPGNDLFDIRYPINWKQLPFSRNLYWLISSKLRVISFINYRLAQIFASDQQYYSEFSPLEVSQHFREKFSVEKYTKRDLIYNLGDAGLVEDSILLSGERGEDFQVFIGKLSRLLNMVPADCRIVLVVIPHMSQLNTRYLNQSVQLGARYIRPNKVLETQYPFIRGLEEYFPNAVIVNALPSLRNKEESGTQVYFSNDSHLNQAGQQVIAGTIASHLALSGIFPDTTLPFPLNKN